MQWHSTVFVSDCMSLSASTTAFLNIDTVKAYGKSYDDKTTLQEKRITNFQLLYRVSLVLSRSTATSFYVCMENCSMHVCFASVSKSELYLIRLLHEEVLLRQLENACMATMRELAADRSRSYERRTSSAKCTRHLTAKLGLYSVALLCIKLHSLAQNFKFT